MLVNHQQPSAGWFWLGAFAMSPGQNHHVEVAGALEGVTVADAVRFVSASVSAPGINYVHADHLGSPQKMTDASKTIVWDAVYTPFGQVHSITGTATNNQRFPGQYFDSETAYHYNYFRDYDPTTGRYIQSDPIGLRGGLNTYRYVGGNPLYWIDPLGLAVEFCSAPAEIAYGFVDHVWLKTGTKEAGAQGAAQNAGDEYEAPYITELAITDHRGNSKTRKGARCEIVPNVDESLVNELLEIGKPLGQFSAFNNCQSFAADIIELATQPVPPGRLDIPTK